MKEVKFKIEDVKVKDLPKIARRLKKKGIEFNLKGTGSGRVKLV